MHLICPKIDLNIEITLRTVQIMSRYKSQRSVGVKICVLAQFCLLVTIKRMVH